MANLELYCGTMEFVQDGNCIDEETCETLDIAVKDGGGGKFFVLKTEQWSFDKPEELLKLLEQAANAFITKQQPESEE